MAITKAGILAFVNEQLKRTETTVDIPITTVLNDLNKHELLEDEDTGTISSAETSIAQPTGYKSYLSMVLTAQNTPGAPLLPMPGGARGIQEARGHVDIGAATGPPRYYARDGDDISFYPAADKEYTYSLKFYKKHPKDAGNIEFADDWENVFNFGATYYMAMSRGLTKYIAIWQLVYIAERESMILAQPKHIRVAGG